MGFDPQAGRDTAEQAAQPIDLCFRSAGGERHIDQRGHRQVGAGGILAKPGAQLVGERSGIDRGRGAHFARLAQRLERAGGELVAHGGIWLEFSIKGPSAVLSSHAAVLCLDGRVMRDLWIKNCEEGCINV